MEIVFWPFNSASFNLFIFLNLLPLQTPSERSFIVLQAALQMEHIMECVLKVKEIQKKNWDHQPAVKFSKIEYIIKGGNKGFDAL